jgi:hypothetical protein
MAEPWLSIPFAADDACVEALAKLVRARLEPGLRVGIAHGDEAWSPDRSCPGMQFLERAASRLGLDPDPRMARLHYQARRSAETFAIFERVRGRDRRVQVIATPASAPAAVRRLLSYEQVGSSVGAVAVAPRVGRESTSPERAGIVASGVEPTLRRLESVEPRVRCGRARVRARGLGDRAVARGAPQTRNRAAEGARREASR